MTRLIELFRFGWQSQVDAVYTFVWLVLLTIALGAAMYNQKMTFSDYRQ